MTVVITSTDDVPELADVLARRKEAGQDTYDEWWEGTYRIVTGPTPEHGIILARLIAFLLPLADKADLSLAAPVNIGLDKQDCRVPDLAVFSSEVFRTSPAFLGEGVALVVEVLSPREQPQAKLDFYAKWQVREYLEIDPANRTIRLWRWTGKWQWQRDVESHALGFVLSDHRLVAEGTDFSLPAS